MKLGIISDTHDRLETLELAIKEFAKQQVAVVIHCGDWVAPFTLEFFDHTCQKYQLQCPTYSVFGNNDGADALRMMERNQALKNPIKFSHKPTLPLELGGRKIIVYHGHDKNLLDGLVRSGRYDVVFHGHTHIPRNQIHGQTLVFNPGSTAKSRQSRLIDEVSVGIYNPKTNQGKIVYLK